MLVQGRQHVAGAVHHVRGRAHGPAAHRVAQGDEVPHVGVLLEPCRHVVRAERAHGGVVAVRLLHALLQVAVTLVGPQNEGGAQAVASDVNGGRAGQAVEHAAQLLGEDVRRGAVRQDQQVLAQVFKVAQLRPAYGYQHVSVLVPPHGQVLRVVGNVPPPRVHLPGPRVLVGRLHELRVLAVDLG